MCSTGHFCQPSSKNRQSSSFVDQGLSIDLLSSGKPGPVHVEADASRGKFPNSMRYGMLRFRCQCVHHAESVIHLDPRLGGNHYSSSQCLPPRFQLACCVVRVQHQGHSKPCRSRTGPRVSEFAPLFVYIHDPAIAQGAFPGTSVEPAVGSGYSESKYVCERVCSGPFYLVRKRVVTCLFLYRSSARAVFGRRR